MKKFLIISIIILVTWSFALAQDLILEKNPEEIRIFAGDSQFYQRETWMVDLKSGENVYSWGKPAQLNSDEVFIQGDGGTLISTITNSFNQNSMITIISDQPAKGKIYLTYPLSHLILNYLYQYNWEPERNMPVGLLLIDMINQSQEAIRNTRFIIAGKEFTLDLEPYETKRLKIDEFHVISAEKISRYDPQNYGDTEVHFFWKLLIPTDILFPAKAEYFEKSSSGVVFLGENYLSGISPDVETEVGKSNDLTVEEKIEKQEKLNQVYSKKGQEVLYDTHEKKVYRIANRGTEKKKIEVFVPLQPSFELIAYSVPLNRVESNRVSFVLDIESQQIIEVALELTGKNLTTGFIF